MTARLPQPGGDDGTWGDILNAYLEVSLASDGTLNNNVVGTNQIQSGAVTNVQLDSSTQSAITKANSSLQPSQLGSVNGIATLNGSSQLISSQLPSSVVSVSSGTAPQIDATTYGSYKRLGYGTPNLPFLNPSFLDAVVDFGIDFTGNASVATTNTTKWQTAISAAQSLKLPIICPQIGICYVDCTSSTPIAIGTQRVAIWGAAPGMEGGIAAANGGVTIRRQAGNLPVVTVTGTPGSSTTRGSAAFYNIAFNGGNLAGDLAVFTCFNDMDCQNVRFDQATGRLMRCLQAFNNRWTNCYFINAASTATSFTGCSWSSGSNQITVVGTIPPNIDNLLVYGNGIPYGTVAQSVSGQVITISQNTTAASTGTGAFTIEGAPATSFEGINGDGSNGSSAVNHLTACEWEGNAGVDLDLAGSPDGQAAPVNITTISNGKQERQIATNHEPVVRERYALGTIFTGFSFNPGHGVTTATGTIAGGSLNTLTLSTSNGSVAVGQQVTGYGAPPAFNLKANGITSSSVLTILGTIPQGGVGSFNVDTRAVINGITTGMQVMSPGSSAITPGTTVSAVSAAGVSPATITLSANPIIEMAGVDIVVGGMFVSSVSGTTVTLNVNATGAHTSQTYTFGGCRSKILQKPGYGYSGGDTILSGVRFQHTGAPDYYIEQLSGIISASALIFTSNGPQPPAAYWRIGSGVAVDDAKIPTRATNCQFPLQLIADERSSTSAALEFRRLPIDGFVIGSTITDPILVGNILAYQATKAGNPTSTLFTCFAIPNDIATGAQLNVRIRWMSPSTGSAVHWQLGAYDLGGVNLAGASYAVVASANSAPSATAGAITFTDLVLPNTFSGNAWVPATTMMLAISRVAGNGGDTLNDVANIYAVDMFYIRA